MENLKINYKEVNNIIKACEEPIKEWMMSLTPQYASFDEYD